MGADARDAAIEAFKTAEDKKAEDMSHAQATMKQSYDDANSAYENGAAVSRTSHQNAVKNANEDYTRELISAAQTKASKQNLLAAAVPASEELGESNQRGARTLFEEIANGPQKAAAMLGESNDPTGALSVEELETQHGREMLPTTSRQRRWNSSPRRR